MSWRARLAALLGGVQGTPGAIDLEGAPALVVRGSAGAQLPQLENPGSLIELGADGRAAAVIVDDLASVSLSDTLRAVRRGGRRFHLGVAPGATLEVNHRGALALVGVQRALRALAAVPGLSAAIESVTELRIDLPAPSLEATLEATRRAVADVRPRPQRPGPPRVVHLTGRLGPGGAERQLCYLAEAQRAEGARVEVWTLTPIVGDDAHYLPDLTQAGVPARAIAMHPRWRPAPPLPGVAPGLVALCERHAAAETLLPLAAALLADPPDVLHCWLDEPCTVGGLAGVLAGVPRVVLSTRNLNPTHIPRLMRPFFAGAYRALAEASAVRLVANSQAGARDYAAWCGVDPGRFTVIPNGVPAAALGPLEDAERAAARRALGYAPDAFLVAGVFRLAPMKRPRDFLDALETVRAQEPRLQAVHLGAGPLAEAIQAEVRRRGLDWLRLLGRVRDPWAHLRLADASLLPSVAEGCPNASLESQGLGVPIVLTDAAGSPETVAPGETGFVVGVGDTEAMAARLLELARDPELRRRMGRAGRARIASEYSVEAMLARTAELYGGAA